VQLTISTPLLRKNMSACCPRCQKPLETAQVDNIQVRFCQGCRGTLLAHPDLVQILEASWRAVSEEQAQKTPFRARKGWQKEAILRCPDCRQAMEKYGYMGLAVILIDRCDRCILVWLETDELQNMVLALAKTNYRSQQAIREAQNTELDFVGPAMQAAAPYVRSGNWLFRDNLPEGLAVAQTLLRLFMK
jgi:Zn-finger nucleic acid-binding protein